MSEEEQKAIALGAKIGYNAGFKNGYNHGYEWAKIKIAELKKKGWSEERIKRFFTELVKDA